MEGFDLTNLSNLLWPPRKIFQGGSSKKGLPRRPGRLSEAFPTRKAFRGVPKAFQGIPKASLEAPQSFPKDFAGNCQKPCFFNGFSMFFKVAAIVRHKKNDEKSLSERVRQRSIPHMCSKTAPGRSWSVMGPSRARLRTLPGPSWSV